MQEIKLAYDVQHTIAAPLATVFAFFSDMHNIHDCTADVVYFEVLDKRTAKWRLETKQELGIRFTPEYTLRYDYEPDNAITWRSVDGNVRIDAALRLSSIDKHVTHIVAREEVAFALPVSAIMANIVKVVALVETRNGMLSMLKIAGKRLISNTQIDAAT